jgi:hypothetical protein
MTTTCSHDWLEDVKVSDLLCKKCGIEVHKGEAIFVGDKMQISVELIKAISEQSEKPQTVVVDRIEVGPDGIKTLWMRKA